MQYIFAFNFFAPRGHFFAVLEKCHNLPQDEMKPNQSFAILFCSHFYTGVFPNQDNFESHAVSNKTGLQTVSRLVEQVSLFWGLGTQRALREG